MIDIKTEKLISVAQAAAMLPPTRHAKKTHGSTIIRWIHRGVRGRRLDALRVGGCWYTSVEALARFAECPHAPADETIDSPSRSRARRADRELDRLGL